MKVYIAFDKLKNEFCFDTSSPYLDSCIAKFYESHRIYFNDMGYRDKPEDAYKIRVFLADDEKEIDIDSQKKLEKYQDAMQKVLFYMQQMKDEINFLDD